MGTADPAGGRKAPLRIKKIAERRTIWGRRPVYGANAAQTSSATMADTMEDVASGDLIVRIPKGTVKVEKVSVVCQSKQRTPSRLRGPRGRDFCPAAPCGT